MTADVLRHGDAAALDAALAAQRAQTLRLFDALRGSLGPAMEVRYLDTVNPPRWELGHVAWFEEFWLARNTERLRGSAARLDAQRAASLLRGADGLYDSSRVAHTRRWHLDLPDAARTTDYAARVRERTRTLLQSSREDDAALYFFRLVLAHEAMHHEAGTMIAQSLGLAVADALPAASPKAQGAAAEYEVPGCEREIGTDEGGFAFDNELGAHRVAVAGLRIDRTPITWHAYLPFIESGGYADARLWTDEGWTWRQRALANGLPKHLRRDEAGAHWERACFGVWQALDPAQPASHLSAHEAAAWCRWAGRRLPTEHEWTLAAEGTDCTWGEVWEWTASAFAPFPGFAPHPYRDYSAPWFDGRPVLKGGSFATAPLLKHPRYRNFFQPGRHDVFAGFRSCAV